MPKGGEEKDNYSQKEEEFLPKMKENTTVPKTPYASQYITPLNWVP